MISKSNERAPLRQRQRILQKCVPHVQHETLVLRRWENETWKILEGDFSSVSPSPWRRANARCFLGSRDGVVVIALASHLRGLGSSHDWVKFVVGSSLCSERFVSGFTGFPLFSKIKISKFQFHRMQDLLENQFRVSGASWVNINSYYNYYYGVVFVALPLSLFKLPVVQRLSFSRSQPRGRLVTRSTNTPCTLPMYCMAWNITALLSHFVFCLPCSFISSIASPHFSTSRFTFKILSFYRR